MCGTHRYLPSGPATRPPVPPGRLPAATAVDMEDAAPSGIGGGRTEWVA